jgi:hypothetical protein
LRGAIWFPWDDCSCSRCSLIIIGHCPHLEGGLSCKCPLFLMGSFSPFS